MMRLAPLKPDLKGKKPLLPETVRLEKIHAALLPGNGAVCALLSLIYLFVLRGGSASAFVVGPVLYLIPGGKLIPSRIRFLCCAHLLTISSHACGHYACKGYYAFSRSCNSEGSSIRVQGSLNSNSAVEDTMLINFNESIQMSYRHNSIKVAR